MYSWEGKISIEKAFTGIVIVVFKAVVIVLPCTYYTCKSYWLQPSIRLSTFVPS